VSRHRLSLPLPASAFLGLVLTLAVVLAALLAPILSPHDYRKQALRKRLLPPFGYEGADPSHPLGTDYLGRDLLSRLLFGARVSLFVGLGAVLVAGSIGTTLGLISGFFGGWTDSVIMRLVDIQLSFPPMLLAITIIAVLGTGLLKIVIVLGFACWVQYARVTRAVTLSIKEKQYVEAARAIGAGDFRIIRYHVFPNALAPIIVIATVNAAGMILAEAALSFLGLGVQPPTPAWGSMLSDGREYFKIAWWTAVFPGLAIMLTVAGINLLAEGLQSGQRPGKS